MKRIIIATLLLGTSLLGFAQEAGDPTATAKEAITKIIEIAKNKDISTAARKEQLEEVIGEYVDLQAAAQRVLAVHWRKASKEEKIAFIGLFKKVLTNTYAALLEEYDNEKVTFVSEEIKKERYAEVESTILSKGTEIPVNYLLLYRNDQWKLYDFVAEGISLVRSYTTEYKGTLRSGGVSALNAALEKKLSESAE